MRRTYYSSKKSLLLVAIVILGVVGIDKSPGQQSTLTESNSVQKNQSGLKSEVDAAELVRGVIADEAAFFELSSFFIRTTSEWTNTPAGIAERTEELVAQFGENVREHLDQFADDLRPHQFETNEDAFDDHRLRSLSDKQSQSHALRVWNGERAVVHEHYYANKQEHIAFDTSPGNFIGEWFMLDFGYLKTGGHSGWWSKEGASTRQAIHGVPDDFKLVGRESFRGHPCWVLENQQAQKRLYISVNDQRIRGYDTLHHPNGDQLAVDYDRIVRRLADKSGDDHQFQPTAWVNRLPRQTRVDVKQKIKDELFQTALVHSRNYMEDYQEIAPGVWWPMKQGYQFYNDDSPQVVTTIRDQNTVEIKVNEKLADELFEFDDKSIEEGMQIYDYSFTPLLAYIHKKDRDPSEWEALVENHKQQNAEREKWQEKMDARVGQTAVEFSKSDWLNSDAQTWKSLKGEIVIIDFWAVWCTPCHNDFQLLKQIHGNQNGSIKVIGVHLPGTPVEEIQATIKEFKLTYPIYVDLVADKKSSTMGEMSDWYSIRGIPHSIVIDKDGIVAGHGTLVEAYEIAQKLKQTVKRESGESVDH